MAAKLRRTVGGGGGEYEGKAMQKTTDIPTLLMKRSMFRKKAVEELNALPA